MTPMTDIDQEEALRSFLGDVGSLPSPPALLFEILDYTSVEELSIKTLGNLVGRDASLTAKLLQTANSSIYNFPGEIGTVERAVMVLGIRSVRLLTLSLMLTGLFSAPTVHGNAVMEVRRRSLVNALANRAFMAEIDPLYSDEGFLAGLLSTIGSLAVAECCPEAFGRLFDECEPRQTADCRLVWPSPDRQREVLGFALDQLTAALFRRWNLPEFLAEVIGARSGSGGAGSTEVVALEVGSTVGDVSDDDRDALGPKLLMSLHLSSLAEEVLCGNFDGAALSNLIGRASAELGLPRERIEGLLVELGPVIAETSGLFGVESAAGIDFSDVVARSAEAMQRLSVEAITMLSDQAEQLADLEQQNETLARSSRVDALTGLSNRAAFDESIETQVAIRRRRTMPDSLALMLFGLDRLDRVEDEHGRHVVEAIIHHVATLLASHCRSGEDVFRVGGDEFALLMPHSSLEDPPGAAERFRALVETSPYVLEPSGIEIPASVSIGAFIAEDFDDPDVAHFFVQSAYQRLYAAKKAGRNQSSVQTRPSS